MGIIENTFHPERKREENWRAFSSEVGGDFTSEGMSGGMEITIPFMDHPIQLSTYVDGRVSRTVMVARHNADDFQFRILGWGSRNVPGIDRDPYLNSEFPDLAPKAIVEFNDFQKKTGFLASPEVQRSILLAPDFFTLESKPNLLSWDNRARGTKDRGIISDVNHLHAALDLFKCVLTEMEAADSANGEDASVVA